MTLSDVECRRVRQRAFQAVADLNNHLAVLDEHKKNHPITPLLLADAPRLCHTPCVIGDIRVALHFRKNRDHDLVGSITLELSKLFVEPRCGFFRNNVGVVVEITVGLRRDDFCGQRVRDENNGNSDNNGMQRSGERTIAYHYGVVAGAGAGELKLNCTGGGFSAPGCAVKNGLGGKPSMPAIKLVGKLRTATL